MVIGRIGVLAAALGIGVVLSGGVAHADNHGDTDSGQRAPRSSVRAAPHAAASTRAVSRPKSAAAARVAATIKPAPVPAVATPAVETPADLTVVTQPRAVVAPVVAAPAPAAATPAPAAPAAASSPAVAAAAKVGSIRALFSPLLGSGTGVPGQSPAGLVLLAASRRAGPVRTRTLAASTPAAATVGTTTTITWAWGTNPVLNFNPSTDKLDFGWMQASQFDVTEKSGSTVIAVVGNNHSYTLKNVPISQLTMTNIIAKDTGTVSKWKSLLSGAQATLPALSIGNSTVAEGNSGSATTAFTVSLSTASTKTVTVGYSTANGTATAGSDYTATSGTLTFAPGVTSQKINVTVVGDTTVEPTETFTVTLAGPTNATLGTAAATGTITNDDVAPPSMAIANATVNEGNSGTSTMSFAVTLSNAYDKTVTVGYGTANGTATAGSDYTAASGTLTFAAGVTSQQINVAVLGDTAVEPTETFTVSLSNPVNGTLGTSTATGTITNDDSSTPPPVTADRWGTSFYAPYVDMGGWPVPDLLAISQTNGGGSLFTAAFMQATPDGKLAWAGLNALEPGATNDQAKAINSSIKALQSAGGDVMISLGGQAGTSLAQWGSTHGMTAAQLASAYAGVIDTYGITHLDFDIEGAAVADATSIGLHSQALKLLQQSKPQVQIWYTLPVLPTGLTADGLKVVDSALKAGVTLAGVNVMAMDYGESAAPTSGAAAKTMGAYAVDSAESTYAQLTKLYSGYGKTFGYKNLGVTPMLGVNDITSEVFTLADAQTVEDYARSKGVGMLALWSVTRDTPGQLGVSTYTHSGMSVPAGSFAKIFNDYGTVNTLNYGSIPPVVSGGTTTTIGWHWGTNTALGFNTATDKLDFVWMQPSNFDINDSSGSTVITIVNNNQTYTLTGVRLAQMSIGNIVALDATTLAKWQAAITAAKAAITV